MWRSSVRARALYKGAECHGCALAGDRSGAGPERKFSIERKLGRVAGGAELGGIACRGVRAPVSAGGAGDGQAPAQTRAIVRHQPRCLGSSRIPAARRHCFSWPR